MSEHPIEGMMDTTLDKIKQMADVDTVVGDPITTADGTVIIPVSKVSYGFASGGSDIPSKAQPDKNFFGGGSGAGITITPMAFLTISQGNVRLLQVEPFNSSADRLAGLVPEVVDTINGFISKNKENKEIKKKAEKVKKAAEDAAAAKIAEEELNNP